MLYQIMGHPEFGERIGNKDVWFIFDLDGVFMRWPGYETLSPRDSAALYEYLSSIQEKNIGITVLTNRPPGHMQAIASSLGVNYGVWITESGGSAYEPYAHQGYVLPEWEVVATHEVPALREALQRENIVPRVPKQSDLVQFEPGIGYVKTVLVPKRGIDTQKHANDSIKPFLDKHGFSSRFEVKPGKGVDIDPKGLSKTKGMEHVLRMNGIDPHTTPTILIADERRDTEAAKVLVERGGYAGAVGNSNPEFAATVRALGNRGIIAQGKYHASVMQIMQQFLARV
jgi:hydroxymethylpyrimidine pyrophosphatase-like HAD family hydrolase